MNGQLQKQLPRQSPMQPQEQGVQGVGLLGMAKAKRSMTGGITNTSMGRNQNPYQGYFNYPPMQNPHLQPPMRPQIPDIPKKRNPMLDMYRMGFQMGMMGQRPPSMAGGQAPQTGWGMPSEQVPAMFTPGV